MRRVARDVTIAMVVVEGGDIFLEQGAVELLEACKRREKASGKKRRARNV